MKNYKIKLFGAFRKFHLERDVLIQMSKVATAQELKEELKVYMKKNIQNFNEDVLIDESALATDSKIITNNEELMEDVNLSILPPVCGG